MKRKSKYNAKPVTIDGIRFASKAEGNRYRQLRILEGAGEIKQLTLQPDFPLHAKGGKLIGKYVADFAYINTETNNPVIEDVKGVKTPMYRWKKKHTEAQYGVTITEVR